MTFYEAAVEVLRRSGRPLHFKKITEVAIRDELLSHVGRTPEVTMESRLDQEVKRDDASWIVKTRPGVYTLKQDVAERLNEEAKTREEAAPKKKRNGKQPQVEEPEEAEEEVEAAAPAEEEEAKNNGRRRRRRRGRGRGSDRDKGEKAEKAPATAEDTKKKESRSRRGKKKENDELDGARFDSIAEAAYATLDSGDSKPQTADEIASVVFEKKLVRFHTHDPEATVQSAIVTDNQVRTRRGLRPLFAQYRNGRWGLTDWGVSDDGLEKERQILALAEELRRQSVDQLGEAVAKLKAEAFEMVVMTLLERLDYSNLKVSKRTSDGDVFFTADWRRGFSDLRVCIQIVADPEAKLSGEAITELRETLEHYSAAEGVVIHLGEITKDAVKQSRDTSKAKVTIIDRNGFVRLLADEGIGVKTYQTPLVMVDSAFIDALQR